MRTATIIAFAFTGLVNWLLPVSVYSQSNPSRTIKEILSLVEFGHLRPREVNDEFGTLVCNGTLESLDPNGLLFSSQDFDRFQIRASDIDEELNRGSYLFADEVTEVYLNRLASLKLELNSSLSNGFDLAEVDSLSIADFPNFANEENRKERWLRWSKLQVLIELFELDSVDQNSVFSEEQIENARAETLSRLLCLMDLDNEIDEKVVRDQVFLAYYKAIAHAFDPHTVYLSASDNQMFASLVSNEIESFGFDIERGESGFLEVSQIFPGGPAWNSNQMNEGDVIVAINPQANNTEIHGFCANVTAVASVLNDPKVKLASFRLRKLGGQEIVVQLKKELVDVAENNIQSLILEADKKVGYIYLPSFYTNEGENLYQLPNGCANDVAKELLQLQAEGIEGLIFDLRGNTGGSMLEAIRLAGLFIDEGTLGVADYRNEDPTLLKDLDRGVVSELPLAVLVNEVSASASELFSASIQDANRGVVTGANTFGKSTIQRVFPLNTGGDQTEFLKMTLGEFYRADGKPIQQLGITPDIQFPGYYDRSKYSEKAYPSSLTSKAIQKETYFQPLASLPIQYLKDLSDARTANNSEFLALRKYELEEQESEYIPLKLQQFKEYYFSDEEEFEAEIPKPAFKVKEPGFRNVMALFEPDAELENEDLVNWLKEDAYLNETFLILLDLINLN